MAVKTSNKATDSTVIDFKYWTGVIPYKVVAVNPNLAELAKLGIEYYTKEPVYELTQTFEGVTVNSSVVDFWLQSAKTPDVPEDLDILVNIRFRINKEPFVGSNTGKLQFINAYGRTAWGESLEAITLDWFLKDGARQAHRGEEELHKFLFAWLNMTYDPKTKEYDNCLIDISKVIAGDVSELRNIVASSSEYIVKCLTGVNVVEKEGKIKYYQAVYNKMFLKHSQTATNRLEEFINKEYNEFNATYTFDIQEFNKATKPDEDSKTEESIAEVF